MCVSVSICVCVLGCFSKRNAMLLEYQYVWFLTEFMERPVDVGLLYQSREGHCQMCGRCVLKRKIQSALSLKNSWYPEGWWVEKPLCVCYSCSCSRLTGRHHWPGLTPFRSRARHKRGLHKGFLLWQHARKPPCWDASSDKGARWVPGSLLIKALRRRL